MTRTLEQIEKEETEIDEQGRKVIHAINLTAAEFDVIERKDSPWIYQNSADGFGVYVRD